MYDNVDYNIDANLVNAEYAGAAADQIKESLEGQERLELEQKAEAEAQAQKQREVEATEMAEDDPRQAKIWGPKAWMKEFTDSFGGGVGDFGNDYGTIPERVTDMVNGEMAREGQDYAPDYKPFNQDNPVSKTIPGKLIRLFTREGLHAGTIAMAIAALPLSVGTSTPASAAGVAVSGGRMIGLAARAPGYLAKLRRVIGIGFGNEGKRKALAAAFTAEAAIGGIQQGSATQGNLQQKINESQLMTELREWSPIFDNPMATKDTDSPFLRSIKNVTERGSFGFLGEAGGLLIAAGAGGLWKGAKGLMGKKPVRTIGQKGEGIATKAYDDLSDGVPETAMSREMRKIEDGRKSIHDQTMEAGKLEMESPDPGGYKNQGMTDVTQGSATSQDKFMTVLKQADEIDNNGFDGKLGSTGTLTTPASVKRTNQIVDVEGKDLERILKDLMGEDRFVRMNTELRSKGLTPLQVYRSSFRRMQEMMEGRNPSEMSVEDFWKPINDEFKFQTGGTELENLEAWAMKNVVTADLVNASLFKMMRDDGLIANITKDVIDPFGVDGPMQNIKEQLVYGIMNVKRSRYLISTEFSKLKGQFDPEMALAKANEKMKEMKQTSEEAVNMMFEIASKSENKELADALIEAFSGSNNIRNWEDLHKWMETKLYGGTIDGQKATGMLTKELQGVFVNSTLSGPKTPVRAILGTSIAGATRPLAQAIGGMATFNGEQARMGLSGMAAMVEALPEAWTIFKTRLNANWNGDVASIKTRFSQYDQRNADWKAMGEYVMQYGDDSMKAAYLFGNMARGLNDNSFLTYSSKLMAATDETFGHIMARVRGRQKAFGKALQEQSDAGTGVVPIIDKKMMRTYEDEFYKGVVDEDGLVKYSEDAALQFMQQEATLTRDLSGTAKAIENIFNSTPWLKPFMLFARTGVNGIELGLKHMPVFKRLVKDERMIMNATPEMADSGALASYGIANKLDLENAKAIQAGRSVIGTSIVTMASMAFISDRLTGNGPMDVQTRKTWEAAGWKPRSIKIGDVWVSYDAFEPFNSMLAYVADVGDNMELMGPEWAEDRLQRVAMVLAQGTVKKSYLAGLSQVAELFNGNFDQAGKVAANLMNNQIPMGGLRNELGKLFNPYMKELNGELVESLRNRNQLTEFLAPDPLPIKYDILNGEPIKDHNFMTRMFNMFSPVQLNLENSPGRTLLFNSNYDMNIAAYANPDEVRLDDLPEVRSMYQQELGKQGLEEALNKLAARKDVQESLRRMEKDRQAGLIGKDPRTYLVNDLINDLFTNAQKAAWAVVSRDARVQELIQAKDLTTASEALQRENPEASNRKYQQAQDLINNVPTR